jgi:hypothetical protein
MKFFFDRVESGVDGGEMGEGGGRGGGGISAF